MAINNIILPLVILLVIIISLIAYLKREELAKWRLKRFDYEKVLRIIIHYEGNKTKTFYRTIPSSKEININDTMYSYDDKSVLKSFDKFAIYDQKEKLYIVKVDDKKYRVEPDNINKEKEDDDIITVHYWHNVPTPINFEVKKKELELSAYQMQQMKINDLFAKLLRLDEQNMLLMIIIIICVVALILVGVNVYISYKTNKALDGYLKVVMDTKTQFILLWGVYYAKRKQK